MTHADAWVIAVAVQDALPLEVRERLKGVDVCPKLHRGMLTIRVYCKNQTAPDPEPFIFLAEELR